MGFFDGLVGRLFNTSHSANIRGNMTHHFVASGETTHHLVASGETAHHAKIDAIARTTHSVNVSGGHPHQVNTSHRFGIDDSVLLALIILVFARLGPTSESLIFVSLIVVSAVVVSLIFHIRRTLLSIDKAYNDAMLSIEKAQNTTVRYETCSHVLYQKIQAAHTNGNISLLNLLENKRIFALSFLIIQNNGNNPVGHNYLQIKIGQEGAEERAFVQRYTANYMYHSRLNDTVIIPFNPNGHKSVTVTCNSVCIDGTYTYNETKENNNWYELHLIGIWHMQQTNQIIFQSCCFVLQSSEPFEDRSFFNRKKCIQPFMKHELKGVLSV
jgi:hypothetical protein